MHKVNFNLYSLITQLDQKRPGNRYTESEIAEVSGISRSTISKLMKGKTRRIDFETLESLLDFFEGEGMPISLNDLFEVTEEKSR